MSKKVVMRFMVQQNTDPVDMENKCLGLSVWVPGDSVNLLNTNRGLHTQIRHNGNKDTYNAAVQLSKLLSQAPAMLEFIKQIVQEQIEHGEYGDQVIINEGQSLIIKAGG